MLKTQLRTRLARWLSGGGMRPVVVVALLAALFVAFPDRNFSLGGADAASSSPACASGVGVGAANSGTATATRGGHGCVVIEYVSGGSTQYETFNYTGADQSWTVPSGVSSVTFRLVGAGGGGVPIAGSYGDGGGAGYATGSYSVLAGDVLTVIVGQGGGGELMTLRSGSGTSGCYTGSLTYGGGGRGSSCWSGYAYADRAASGGGRSAVRIANGTEVVTAGGGAGGGWSGNGGAGGGTSGTAGTGGNGGGGGTQTAGGTVTNTLATRGAQYLGGNGYHQGGGVVVVTTAVAVATACQVVVVVRVMSHY